MQLYYIRNENPEQHLTDEKKVRLKQTMYKIFVFPMGEIPFQFIVKKKKRKSRA